MRESCTYGSKRGALSNERSYRDRREFIMLLSGAAAAWPLAARAQQPAMPVIGYLAARSPQEIPRVVAAFRQGLAETGYVEGQSVAIEFLWPNNTQDIRESSRELRALAEGLVRRQVAVIVAAGSLGSARAAKAASSTVPIVFHYGGDPVSDGLVASLNRPGGNVTGVTSMTTELAGKRLELLGQLVPQATTIAFLAGDSRSWQFEEQTGDVLAAGRALGRQVIVVEVPTASQADLEAAFATLVQRQVGALIVGVFPNFISSGQRIAALAAHHKIPAMYADARAVFGGGLIGYTGSFTDDHRKVGVSAGRILKGENPADLPVQRSTKFDLIINLKTAKALGLTVPRMLLVAATEVIQ